MEVWASMALSAASPLYRVDDMCCDAFPGGGGGGVGVGIKGTMTILGKKIMNIGLKLEERVFKDNFEEHET